MPPTRKRRGRRELTDEELAAIRERNEQLLDHAEEALHDPAEVADRLRTVLATGSTGSLLHYSLRNLILLTQQAEERGIDLTEVDTGKGWRTRGRHILPGERALYLTQPTSDPKGQDGETSGGDAGESAASSGGSDGTEEGARRPRFRMSPRFDLSQTGDLPHIGTEDPENPAPCVHCAAPADQPCMAECDCAYCQASRAAVTTTEPGETIWASLVIQIEREGYTFDWPADPQHLGESYPRNLAVADHDTRALHVAPDASAADPDALAAITVALADILTQPREEAETGDVTDLGDGDGR
ncbi:hypothetical protein [Cryptosporangium sp. NPDC048952]|uniref:hypothetical protein n=1 Tax=Cryptosporangium sp. NPDC048952 TaxID=3363961 RepID=UPI0037156403